MNVRRPRIAMVTDAIAPYHRGGKEQRYDELAARLTEYAEVHVYTMRWWRSGPRTTRAGVTYHAICPLIPLYRDNRRSIRQAVVFAIACLRLMFARFDVIEADHMPYLQLFPLKLVALVRRRRLVVTWHESWDQAQWQAYLGRAGLAAWWLEQVAMRLPDCIIAASSQTAERLSARTAGRTEVIVAPNGIDLELARRTRPAEDLVDLVSVGRMLKHKRFDLILEALARLAESGHPMTCRFIGTGPERRSLVAQAQRLGLSHLVEFRHDVRSHAELHSLLKASRLFVFASEREGFGIAALEAIACGLPVITTNAPHNLARHLVTRSAAGVVCDPTAEALAAAIQSNARRVTPAETHAEASWLHEYEWELIARRVAEVLAPGCVPARAPGAVSERRTPDPVPTPASDPRSPGRSTPMTAGAARSLPPIAGGAKALATAAQPLEGQASSDSGGTGPTSTTSMRSRLGDALGAIVAVGVIAGLANVRGIWILQAAELLLLATVPGVLALRALRTTPASVVAFPIYTVCASLAVLMLSGLAVDLIGPGVGVRHPLTTVPLTVALATVCVILIAISLTPRTPRIAPYLSLSVRIRHLWPLLLPALAWAGAGLLSNGHGPAVAIIGVSVIGLALLGGAWQAERWGTARCAILLYGAALGLIWGFTLRGRFVYGFDISGEYQTLIQVVHAGRWHAAHPGDAYGAMLSLTILPTSLVKLTGASPLLVLKAIFPLLFALVPVAVFLLAGRILRARFAYLAALFIIVQDYFFQQLPSIARQEIALLFFVGIVAALFDPRLRRATQVRVGALFAIGLVMSHYGTTYLTIALLGLALIAELARWAVKRRPLPVGLVAIAATLVVLGGSAALWYGPVTDSARNLSQFFSDINTQGISVLPNAGGKDILHSYLAGNVATKVPAAEFSTAAHDDFVKNRPYVHPLPQAASPTYALHDATVPNQRIRSHPVVRIMDTEQVLVSQLSILLAVIGSALLWLRSGPREVRRGVGALAVATVVVLVVIRFSGTAANDYNQSRAFLQAMIPLSICLAWLLQLGSRKARVGRAIPVIFVAGLAGVFLTTTGVTALAAGGGERTNLADHGEDYDRYYVVQPELAAARWANAAAPPGEIVSTDRYGQLRLLAATGRSDAVLPVLTPLTLDQHAWIYADRTNFRGRLTRGQEDSRYALYAWPGFVDRLWNLVYSNGTAGVYARTH